MAKTYTRWIVARWGSNFELCAERQNDGTFRFYQPAASGFGKERFDPTPGDWQSLALALTEHQDANRQADADMLETLQDERDEVKALADALEYLAEGCEARKCKGCGRYSADGQQDDDGDWYCEPCVDEWEPVCKCGGGGCMRCIGVPSSGPI